MQSLPMRTRYVNFCSNEVYDFLIHLFSISFSFPLINLIIISLFIFKNSFVHLEGALRSDMLNDLCDKLPCSDEAEAVVEKTMIWTELEACKRQVFCLFYLRPHLFSLIHLRLSIRNIQDTAFDLLRKITS